MRRSRSRTPRPHVYKFNSAVLTEKLDALGRVKLPFNWDGTSYGNLSRSVAPDLKGLETHALVLMPMAQVLPSGFGSHVALVGSLSAMQWRHGIFPGVKECRVQREAHRAANNWSIMMRGCYNQ